MRFRLGKGTRFAVTEREHVLWRTDTGETLVLRSTSEATIAESDDVVVVGSGYASEQEAAAAAAAWRQRLVPALSRVHLGGDFGVRSVGSGHMLTQGGRAWLRTQFGMDPDDPLITDHLGEIVYEDQPRPSFVRGGEVDLQIGIPVRRLEAALSAAVDCGYVPTESEVLAYDMFAVACAQQSADTRFLTLMIAVEALIEPAPRPEQERRHVKTVIEMTKAAALDPGAKASLLGSLHWLLDESIGQAGRRLARTLEPRRYLDETPSKFFTKCYEMRSRLVHGHLSRPTPQEVSSRAAQLERFVADLLSGPLRDIKSIDN